MPSEGLAANDDPTGQDYSLADSDDTARRFIVSYERLTLARILPGSSRDGEGASCGRADEPLADETYSDEGSPADNHRCSLLPKSRC